MITKQVSGFSELKKELAADETTGPAAIGALAGLLAPLPKNKAV